MPCPFPGMDPYLEDTIIFPDFHDGFITYLREAMQPVLPAHYYAALGRRAWVEVSERFVSPDVSVAPAAKDDSKPLAATWDATQPIVAKVPHDEQVETLVEIFVGRGNDRRLVTAIELLSLSNKTPGERGRNLVLAETA